MYFITAQAWEPSTEQVLSVSFGICCNSRPNHARPVLLQPRFATSALEVPDSVPPLAQPVHVQVSRPAVPFLWPAFAAAFAPEGCV